MTNYLIVGTGLAALGATRALIENGIKPVVFDIGKTLPDKNRHAFNKMRNSFPTLWTDEMHDRFHVSEKVGFTSIPKKTVFQSSYFFENDETFTSKTQHPPTSQAFGGLSAGWGASVLPITKEDSKDWPIGYDELWKATEQTLSSLPYSCEDDDLSLEFPLPKNMQYSSYSIPEEEQDFLTRMRRKNPPIKGRFCLGRSRQLVRYGNSTNACQYCGHCMGGCVFDSIYSSADEFTLFKDKKLITYFGGRKVLSVTRQNEKIRVIYHENKQKKECFFDKVLVAAGAFNSSRIFLESQQEKTGKLELKSRGGIVMPVFSFKAIRNTTKLKNTLPTIFIEYLDPFSSSWVHTQVSIGNEIFENRLNKLAKKIPPLQPIIRFFLERTLILLVNFHSKHGGTYHLKLFKDTTGTSFLSTRYVKKWPTLSTMFFCLYKISSIFLKIGCLPLFFFTKLNSGSYHVGSSLQMSDQPNNKNQTNHLGQPDPTSNIYYVDSSVFPSLPGTSIGLVSIANAYRIGMEIVRYD